MDIKSPEERSINMSHIRSRDTAPEIFIRKSLFADGYRYVIGSRQIPGHPDLWMPKYNVAVFIHGCFWHRHDGCKYAYNPKSRTEFWQTKFDNNKKRDQQVRELLHEANIRQLIIWECTVKQMMKDEEKRKIVIAEAEKFINIISRQF